MGVPTASCPTPSPKERPPRLPLLVASPAQLFCPVLETSQHWYPFVFLLGGGELNTASSPSWTSWPKASKLRGAEGGGDLLEGSRSFTVGAAAKLGAGFLRGLFPPSLLGSPPPTPFPPLVEPGLSFSVLLGWEVCGCFSHWFGLLQSRGQVGSEPQQNPAFCGLPTAAAAASGLSSKALLPFGLGL